MEESYKIVLEETGADATRKEVVTFIRYELSHTDYLKFKNERDIDGAIDDYLYNWIGKKRVTVSVNHWFIRLMKFTYCMKDSQLPKDSCKLGWYGILLLPKLILTFPIIIIQRCMGIDGENWTATIWSILLIFVGYVVGDGVYQEVLGTGLNPIVLTLLGMITAIVGIIGFIYIVIGILLSIGGLSDLFKKYRWKRREKRKAQGKIVKPLVVKFSFISEWFKSKKDKSCFRVNWE